jgi:D-3-phosphoglycerate dehydrogenase
MKNIVITTPTFARYSDSALTCLRQGGLEIVRVPRSPGTEADVLQCLNGDTVAIIAGLEPITRKVMASAPALKVVAKHGIGVDNIDLDAAKDLGVRVVNAPGTNSEAVADLVFGLMFCLARRIPDADAKLRAGEWPRVIGKQVWGAALGILGLGMIGKAVARRARGFNMTVLAYDPYFNQEFARSMDVRQASIEEILAASDFVTLHMPYMESTKNLIGEKELKKMKPSAYLINAARGGVVDEGALLKALTDKTIAGAGIDAFSKEPPAGSPLLALSNVVVTPHMGAYTEEALQLTSEFAARTVLEVLEGKKPACIIV